jgi:hypothetical protein
LFDTFVSQYYLSSLSSFSPTKNTFTMAAPITSRTETLQKYLKLDQKGMIMAEYVWVDAEGGTRSKSRVSSNF